MHGAAQPRQLAEFSLLVIVSYFVYRILSATEFIAKDGYYRLITIHVSLLLHPFKDLFSRTTWVSRYQKDKTSLDLNEATDGGVLRLQWHQLDHMQTICTSLRTDNHTSTSSLKFYRRMLFLTPNQQCQSTEGPIEALTTELHNIKLLQS